MKKTSLIVAALLSSTITATAAHAETREIRVPKSLVTTAANAYASGMEINLDNWGSYNKANGGTWHVDNSYVLLPSGKKISLPIPRSPTLHQKVVNRDYNAYVDNLTSQTIDVKADGDNLKLRVFFESAGDEIRIGCRRKGDPCDVHLMKHKGQINNAQAYAWLKPTFSGAKIGLAPVDATLDFDVSLDSWILENLKNVAGHFVSIKGLARNGFKQAFMTEFAKPQVTAQITKDLNAAFQSKLVALLKPALGTKAPGWVQSNVKITKIATSGTDYVITVQYPDIVGPNAVKITSFKLKSKHLAATCPFNFGFDATVQTTAKTSGQAWLQLANGTAGKKVAWNMPKAGSATSTMVYPAQGMAGMKTNRMAKLVVTWIGSGGIPYKTESAMQAFSYTCLKSAGGLKEAN